MRLAKSGRRASVCAAYGFAVGLLRDIRLSDMGGA